MDDKTLIEAAVKQISEDSKLTNQWLDRFERDIDKLDAYDLINVATTALSYLETTLLKEKFSQGASAARQAAVITSKIGDDLLTKTKKSTPSKGGRGGGGYVAPPNPLNGPINGW